MNNEQFEIALPFQGFPSLERFILKLFDFRIIQLGNILPLDKKHGFAKISFVQPYIPLSGRIRLKNISK